MHFSFDTANLCLKGTEKTESTYKEGILSTFVKIVPKLFYLKLFQSTSDG